MKRTRTFILLFTVLLIAAPAIAPVAIAQVAIAPVTTAQVGTSMSVSKAQVEEKESTATAVVEKGREDAAAQGDTTGTAVKPKKRPRNAKMTPQRIQYVESFVGEHHTELTGMLELLKKSEPNAYRRAMDGINRSISKLESVKKRKPHRYPAAVELWKLSSKINVASAKLKREDNDSNRKNLEVLLGQRIDHQVEALKVDRKELEERIARLDELVAKTQSGKNEQIKKRLEAARATPMKKKKPPTPKK